MHTFNRRDFIKLSLALPLLGTLTSCNIPGSKEECLTWTSINVCSEYRQGDSHLISKHGKHYLIDGGHPEVTKSLFLPFLRKKKITHLDAVMINHPHSDHYGGIKALFEQGIKVDRLYMNMPTEQQMKAEWYGGKYEDLLEIRRLAKKAGVPISPIKKGDIFRFDEQSWMEVLYVYDGFHTPVGHTDINDMSAITLIRDGKNRFLLTGDLNKALGGWLAEHGENLKADVVKMPHHGTEDLAPNSFFEKVAPRDIIVTAPQRLWCSKRSKRIRDLAEKHHYGVYVNGFQGDITVVSCEDGYHIVTQKRDKPRCNTGPDGKVAVK